MRETSSPSTSENKTRQLLWRLVSALVTIGLLFFLLRNLEEFDFAALLGRISFLSLLAALFSYLALNIFRAVRFRILLDKGNAPLRLLIPITLYHNCLVRVLPFKLGELSYIVLLRSRLRYSMEEGLSSLLGARILELLIIVVVFASGILLSGEAFAAQSDQLMLIIGLVFVASVVGLYFAGSLIRLSLRLLDPLISGGRWMTAMTRKMLEIAVEFDRIRHPRLFLSALFISCFTYISSFMTNYILLRALGLEAALPVVIAIISVGMFGSAFPFSVSGFGVVELSWLFGLTQFAGYTDTDATAIGFLLHGFQLMAAALYGLAGYLLIHLAPPVPSSAVMPPEAIQHQEGTS